MFSLFQLLLKNFKILTRSRTATAAIFFGPIVLVLLLGAAFNTAQLYGLKLATYSPEYNELTDSIVSKLSAQFLITKAASSESCIEGVKVNEWHVCFIFPENFSIKDNNKIDFYVDPTHINLVHTIINLISVKVEERTEEIRVSLIESIMEDAISIEEDLSKSKQTITDLKNSVEGTKNSLESMKEGLSKLDFDLSYDEFKTSELKDILNKIKTENSKIESEAASINESSIRTAIETASEAIKNALSNATSITNQLQDAAASAITKFNEISQAVEKTKQDINTVITKLDAIIAQLDELNNKIETIEGYAKNIRDLSASRIAQPITANINQIIPEKSYLELILPLLIALVLLFGGVFLGSSLIISEKKSKAYFRNFILPTNKGMFVLSTYLTAIIVLMFQVLVLFAILAFVIVPPFSNLLFLSVFLIGSIFILIGMAIGYASRTAETSVLITIVVILFILFFSNLVLPIETIAYLKELALYNPLTIATNTIKSMSLLGLLEIKFHTNVFILLAAYIAALFGLAFGLQEFAKRHV